MNKLTKQSPLYDITKRINEIIDELNNNSEIYKNFKPDIKGDFKKTYTDKSIPTTYKAQIMGLYNIELKTERASLKLELFRSGKSEIVYLDIKNKVLNNVFMSKGDKIVLKESSLVSTDSVIISLEMNILDAFVDQYEAVKDNIEVVTKISSESSKQFEEMRNTIQNFYKSIEFEPVTKVELKALIDSLGA